MKLLPAFLLIVQLTCENHVGEKTAAIDRTAGSSAEQLMIQNETGLGFLVNTGRGLISLDKTETGFSLQKKLGRVLKEMNIVDHTATGGEKIICYDGLELQVFSSAGNRKEYRIMEITISSPAYEVGDGARVGDSMEKIVRLYPSLWTCIGNTAKEYIVTVTDDDKTIVFDVRNNRASRIRLYSVKP